MGIAAGSDGNLYVSDIIQIDVFDLSGGLLKTIVSGGGGNGGYWYPDGLALDGSGNLLVADPYNSRILKFSKSGDLLMQLGSSGTGDGAFSGPADVAVDGKGNIYVLDTGNYRIQKFDSSGKYLTQWGTPGTGDGQFWLPRGVAADGSGFVYVADSYNYRVQVFTGDGAFVKVLGGPVWGYGDGEFVFPTGVATDAMGTKLYVADSGNYRVQAFVGFGVTHFAVSAPSSADAGSALAATVTALDAAGKVVTGYTGTVRLASSDGSARLPANMPLTNGVGTFQVTLTTPGEQTLTATDSVTASITGVSGLISVSPSPRPDLTIDNRHFGDFLRGGRGTFMIQVTNVGTAPTLGGISVVDRLPQGVTVKAMQGEGWSCDTRTLTCTRSNPLVAGASYPPIMVTVKVSPHAPQRLVNQVSVSGGGESNTLNNTASDEIEVQQEGKGHQETSSPHEDGDD